jgi:putative membrane protein
MANEKKSGGFLLHTVVVGIAVWVSTQVIPGVTTTGPIPLLIMAVVLGLVNAIVRPVLLFVTLPLTFLTLGLFYFVVNGLAFNLAAALVPGFDVDTLFWSGILAAMVVSVVSWVIGLVLGTNG